MWVATLIRPAVVRSAGTFWKRAYALKCDRCGLAFEADWNRARAREPGARHFCSRRCTAAATAVERWTDERRARKSEAVAAWNRERWADDEARRRQADRIAQTHADRDLRARRAASIRATMSTEAFKRKRSLLSKLNAHRAMATNRQRGNVRESRDERAFVAWLREELGHDAVAHHPARVQGADVDVYVRPLDLYVQFDGVYYHGLDRPYDELSPEIRRKFDRDRAVDALFARLGLRLVRITDKQWQTMTTPEARRAWLTQAT